jgi:hypothetical protein
VGLMSLGVKPLLHVHHVHRILSCAVQPRLEESSIRSDVDAEMGAQRRETGH